MSGNNSYAAAGYTGTVKASHLGVPFRPGGKTRPLPFATTKWAPTAKRRIRTQRLGRRIGLHAVRTGTMPATV